MNGKIHNRLFTLLILAFPFCVFLVFLIFMADDTLPPPQPLPNPNGYDDLVKAGEMLASNTEDYYELNQQQLRTLVENNSNALQMARAGLKLQSRVPLKFSPLDPNLNKRLSSLKRLAQAFAAEGKSAEMENRPAGAAKSYLDVFQLGNESARGGILIDALVSVAIEEIATSHLEKIVGQLDAKSCRETMITLETLGSQRPTWENVLQQENGWSERTFGLREQITKLIHRSSRQENLQHAKDAIESSRKKENQLLIDLAVHAYELDKGHPPASISDLVPGYLKAIPQDPFTGTKLVYPAR